MSGKSSLARLYHQWINKSTILTRNLAYSKGIHNFPATLFSAALKLQKPGKRGGEISLANIKFSM